MLDKSAESCVNPTDFEGAIFRISGGFTKRKQLSGLTLVSQTEKSVILKFAKLKR